jgi:hypothetical protein
MTKRTMAQKLAAVFIASVLIITLVPAATLSEGTSSFTVMVYLCGTDLESEDGSGTSDLEEMLSAGIESGGPVNVLIETGGTKTWNMDGIDSDKNQRWLLGGDELQLADEQDQSNMGDSNTLQSFLEYGITNFPADRYGLILWDHGGGSTSGVCFDELTDDNLTISEIAKALDGAAGMMDGRRFSFVGFDACLMATFEMANYLSKYADYMIASEELEPGYGWDYVTWLNALSRDPGMDMETLGKKIVDSFVDTNLYYDPDEYVTLSLLDLSGMDDVTVEMESIGAGLSQALESGKLRTISRQRQNMRTFGDFDGDNTSDMVDILQFAEIFSELSNVDTSGFESALDNVVAYSRYSDNLENVSGMSVLVPFATRKEFPSYGPDYDFGQMYPCFTDFITGYTQMLNGSDYVFTATSSAPLKISGQEETEEAALVPEGYDDENMYAYSLELSDEDMENLSYVEGNLMMDVSEDDFEAYIDLGYLQNAQIDWENGVVYSMFDGTWPMLEGQLVCMTDQTVTEKTRRSIIDVTVNGDECYLLVIFDDKRPGGEVVGYTEGYNENGLPVRGYEKLKAGDVIVPIYQLISWDEMDNEQSETFEGDPITVTDQPLKFGYEDLNGSDASFVYAFCLNDIFGEYEFSDFISFDM